LSVAPASLTMAIVVNRRYRLRLRALDINNAPRELNGLDRVLPCRPK